MGQLIAWLIGIVIALTIVLGVSLLAYSGFATSFELGAEWLGLTPILGWFVIGSVLGILLNTTWLFNSVPKMLPSIPLSQIRRLVKLHLSLAAASVGIVLASVLGFLWKGPILVHSEPTPPPAIVQPPTHPATKARKKPKKALPKTAPANPEGVPSNN
jgi:hypothetical protein